MTEKMTEKNNDTEPTMIEGLHAGRVKIHAELTFASFTVIGEHVEGVFIGWHDGGRFRPSPKIKTGFNVITVLPDLTLLRNAFETLPIGSDVLVEYAGMLSNLSGQAYKNFIISIPNSDNSMKAPF